MSSVEAQVLQDIFGIELNVTKIIFEAPVKSSSSSSHCPTQTFSFPGGIFRSMQSVLLVRDR